MTDLRVGFAGLGRMGLPMARRLAAHGLLAGTYNRNSEKSRDFAAAVGAASFATPALLAAESNVIVTMVADGEASRSLFTGPGGFLEGAAPGSIMIEMSTVGIEHLTELSGLAAGCACGLVDAPVSGSVAMAADGTLTVLAGGEPGDFERIRPVLAALGSPVFHLGGLGCGAAMKLAVNTVVYALNQGLSEGLVLAERAGIQRELAYQVFASSAVAAPFVHYRRELFESPESAVPAFRLRLGAKDLELILALAATLGLDMPQAKTDLEVLHRAVGEGLAEEDVSAVAELLRRYTTAVAEDERLPTAPN
jgi:3-hydroxyisobutyrate dehydrogenase-like beta-hydroxyacid dehydrogenase